MTNAFKIWLGQDKIPMISISNCASDYVTFATEISVDEMKKLNAKIVTLLSEVE
jgi:hypothetical protein